MNSNSLSQVKPPLSILSPNLKGFDLILWGSRMGQGGCCAWPMKGWCAPFRVHVDRLWTSGHLWNPPEPSGSFPVQYRKKPNFFRNPKYDFPYINLYLRTIPELLVISWIPSGTPNNLRTFHYYYLNITLALSNVKRATLRVRESCRHDRDTSLVNNQ